MTPFVPVYEKMQRYNREVAPGSECNAWQDFVADTYRALDESPWYAAGALRMVSPEFADYWYDVARGKSADYDADTGGRIT